MSLYDVILLGFPDGPRVGATPAEAVMQVFGVPEQVAERMVSRVPIVVKSGVTEEVARKYFNAFAYMGAACEFRPTPSASQPGASPPPEPSGEARVLRAPGIRAPRPAVEPRAASSSGRYSVVSGRGGKHGDGAQEVDADASDRTVVLPSEDASSPGDRPRPGVPPSPAVDARGVPAAAAGSVARPDAGEGARPVVETARPPEPAPSTDVGMPNRELREMLQEELDADDGDFDGLLDQASTSKQGDAASQGAVAAAIRRVERRPDSAGVSALVPAVGAPTRQTRQGSGALPRLVSSTTDPSKTVDPVGAETGESRPVASTHLARVRQAWTQGHDIALEPERPGLPSTASLTDTNSLDIDGWERWLDAAIDDEDFPSGHDMPTSDGHPIAAAGGDRTQLDAPHHSRLLSALDAHRRRDELLARAGVLQSTGGDRPVAAAPAVEPRPSAGRPQAMPALNAPAEPDPDTGERGR